MPAAENATDTATVSMPTPATAAAGLSPSFRAETAWCAATSDDEQAVSVVWHGPVRPSVYERRPDSTDSAPAVAEYPDVAVGTFAAFSCPPVHPHDPRSPSTPKGPS